MAKTHTTTSAVKQDINDVWKSFKRHKSEELRNLLMLEYISMVKYNAERIYSKLPDEVELDDLGVAGLVGADILVSGLLLRAALIADGRRRHAGDGREGRFDSPKTSCCEGSLLLAHGR